MLEFPVDPYAAHCLLSIVEENKEI